MRVEPLGTFSEIIFNHLNLAGLCICLKLVVKDILNLGIFDNGELSCHTFLVIDIAELTYVLTSLLVYLLIVEIAVVVVTIWIQFRNLTLIVAALESTPIECRILVIKIRNSTINTDGETSGFPILVGS